MNILCGTDFSMSARQAAAVAGAWAAKRGDCLSLVHAIEDEDCAGLDAASAAELKSRFADHLRHQAEQLAADGALVRHSLEFGRADEVLAKLAEPGHTRMIVVAAIGEHGGDPARVGSVAECLIARASVPVLVVRNASVLRSWIRGEQPLKVFVAFDFTASADTALSWVNDLRAVGPCDVTVGYVGTREGARPEDREAGVIEEQLRRRVRAVMERELVTVRVQTEAAAIAPALAAMASGSAAQVFVSGSHHLTPWHHLLHGSVSQELLQDTRMSIACIPSIPDGATPIRVRAPERILVATDFSAQGNRAVAEACALARAGNTVKIVYVATPGTEGLGALRRLRAAIPPDAEGRGIRTVTEVIPGKRAAEAIRAEAEHFDADLICVGTKDRSAFSRATVGSVARTLVNRSKRPLLVIHPPEP